MNYIHSYCKITTGGVWLNGKKYFKSTSEPFVVGDFLTAIYKHIGVDYRRFYKMDVLSKLGFLASEILLANSDREQPKPDMGIILFNKNASLEGDRNFQKTIRDKDDFFPSPAEFVYTLPNIVNGEIAIRNKIYGETAFYVVADFQQDMLYEAIENMVNFAGMKRVLAGWAEVDAFTGEYNAFMVLCETQ